MINRVLVVESNAALSRLFERNLAKRGYSVTAVGSAEEALQVLGSEYYDLIISDAKLRGMSGLEFINQLPSYLRVMLLADVELKHRLPASVVKTFQMPFGLNEFISAVDSVLVH